MNKGKFASLILLGAFSAGVASSSAPGIAVKSEEKNSGSKSSSNNKNIVKTNLVTDMVSKFIFSSCSIGVASGILVDILSLKRNERENGQNVYNDDTNNNDNDNNNSDNNKDNGYNNNSVNNNVTEDLANEGKVKNLILLYFTGIFGIILSFVFFVKVIGPFLRKYKIKGAIKAANLVLQKEVQNEIIKNPNALKIIKEISNLSADEKNYLNSKPELFAAVIRSNFVSSEMRSLIILFKSLVEEVQNEIIKNPDALNEISNLSPDEKNYLNSKPKLFAAVIRSKFVSSEMESLVTTLSDIGLKDSGKKNFIENYLPNVEPKLLKVLFSEESSESLKILIRRPAMFKKFIEYVNKCYDEEALKCLLSIESGELLKFLIENELEVNLWSDFNEERKLLFSCGLLKALKKLGDPQKKQVLKKLFEAKYKNLCCLLGEDNKTLIEILSGEEFEDSLEIMSVFIGSSSDSLEIFLKNYGLKRFVPGRLNIIKHLLGIKLDFFKKIVDKNNLMDSILVQYEEKYIVPILEHLSSVGKDDIKVITALIDHDIFGKQNAIKIIRFASFFKGDKFLEILSEGNKAKDFYDLNIGNFDDDVFKDGKKVVFKFIKDNNISLDNLLTFDLDAINFFFSKEFLLSGDGQINEEKKEIFIKILNNKGLAETFVKLDSSTINFLFKEGIDFVEKVLGQNNAVDIVNALSFQNINNPVALTQLLQVKNNKPFFLAIMFGKYGAENEVELTVKTPTYDENGKKIVGEEVKFKFGKDPSHNVEELFKELKKDFGTEEALARIRAVATAYNEWVKKSEEKANVDNIGNNNSFNNVQNNNLL